MRYTDTFASPSRWLSRVLLEGIALGFLEQPGT